jgi:hypothetical protein
MHGAWIEQHGLDEPHPRHGPYRYDDIVQAFAERDFEVISEVRQGQVHPMEYAMGVADQVLGLLKRGVPPAHIAVLGHSKGGLMTLMVASLVQEPEVRYVVLAGCGKSGGGFRRSYEPFLRGHAQDLRGRILSLYDAADGEAGTCREAFSQRGGLETDEIVLRTGKGHGLFYAPEQVWLAEVFDWLH